MPSEIFEYFKIRELVFKERSIAVFLDERDIKPAAYSGIDCSLLNFSKQVFWELNPIFLLISDGLSMFVSDWYSISHKIRLISNAG